MKITIDGHEPAYVLRAISAALASIAKEKWTSVVLSRNEGGCTGDPDPIPLTDGDAPARSGPVPGGTVIVAGMPGTGVVLAPVGDPTETTELAHPVGAKLKRTRAARAVAQLSLAPTAPEVPAVTPLVPSVPAVTAPAAPVAEVPSVPTPPVTIVTASGTTGDVAQVTHSAPADSPKSFPELMRLLAPALASKRLTGDGLNAAVVAAAGDAKLAGVDSLQGLIQNQQLIPAVYAYVLTALGGVL